MKNFKIFVEGVSDKRFIEDFLLEHYGLSDTDQNVINIGGIEKLMDFKKLMIINKKQGGINLSILDSDFPQQGTGFVKRLEDIKSEMLRNDVSSELYLLPNHQDDGTIEDLLENIIAPTNQSILDCWMTYENCIQKIEGKTLTIPAKKSKIYSYLECLLPNTNSKKKLAKDKNRDFRNIEHWEIGNLKNPYIKAIKSFLDQIQ